MATVAAAAPLWLSGMKQKMEEKMGALCDIQWSQFVQEVALWLRQQEGKYDDVDIVSTVVGLIKYGIQQKEDLIRAAGQPPNREVFNREIKVTGVLPAICNNLFLKYVRSQQQQFDIDVWDVAGFLRSIGVDETDIDSAATTLTSAGYKTETYLLAATETLLEKAGVALPVIGLILRHQHSKGGKPQHSVEAGKYGEVIFLVFLNSSNSKLIIILVCPIPLSLEIILANLDNLIIAAYQLAQRVTEAYELKFTIIRDNRQADGLRRRLTELARKNSAFYTTQQATQDMHDEAFKSLNISPDANLAEWKGEDESEREARLLSVHLLFLSFEKATAFKFDVLELLLQWPSSKVFDSEAQCLSPIPEEAIQIQRTTAPDMPSPVFDLHYLKREQPGTPPNDSLEFCDMTSFSSSLPPGCDDNFNTDDPLWPYHAIEHQGSFTLFAEKAHIFPHKECQKYEKKKEGRSRTKILTGYEWLDDPSNAEFNFLYLSMEMHTCFDVSGRTSKDVTQPAICIEPEARTIKDSTGFKRFKIEFDDAAKEYRATIPLRVWCKSDEVATLISRKLSKGAEAHRDNLTSLPYFSNISIQCVHRNIAMQPETLFDGDSKQHIVVYSKKVPFMDERLSNAWSLNRETGELSTTEIMEKCLLWSANETWNTSWKNVVANRNFASREA